MRGFMTVKEELALLRKIVKLAKTVQDHVQFPPRGGQCWCEQCEAIRWYDDLKKRKA